MRAFFPNPAREGTPPGKKMMGLSYLWSYLYYLTGARSEYYVHSPFVYSLMTECLKKKRRLVPESRDRLFARIQDYLSSSDFPSKFYRILPGESIEEAFRRIPRREDTAIFIDSPHQSLKRETQWNALCAHPQVILTIDLFRAGLAFPCHPMSKEHFCLRYF